MSWSFAMVLAALPALALADVNPRFAKLRDSAESVGGLGQFLESYVGDCASELLGGGECKQTAAAFRKKASGKKFYMIITEDAASMISMGTYNLRGEFTLNVTPFFAAAGSAVTHGAPARTDRNGNPVLPYLTVKGTVPEGGNASSISRMASMRVLRLQVVFTPQGLWSLPKKGGGKSTGVRAKIDGMLITVGRTGEQVGVWFAK